jgi:hypothetical protein
MLSREELERLRLTPEVNINELKEIREVKLNMDLPLQDRLELFLYQMGNPYYFKALGTPVQISYKEGVRSLNEALRSYLSKIKSLKSINEEEKWKE